MYGFGRSASGFGHSMAPRWSQEAPGCRQDGTKMGPGWPQDGPRMAPRKLGPQETRKSGLQKSVFFKSKTPFLAESELPLWYNILTGFGLVMLVRHAAGTLVACCWHIAGTLPARCWHAVGTLLARCWHAGSTLLARCWHVAGTMLARCWHAAGTPLAFSWHAAGTRLARW